MANEAVLVFKIEEPIPFTVANATGIEKGALCVMSDPMTAATASATTSICAGIAASEKVASDGKTKLGIYRHGIFKVYLSGACTIGAPLTCIPEASHPNYMIIAAASTCSGSKTWGYALETGADNETILMDLSPGTGAAL